MADDPVPILSLDDPVCDNPPLRRTIDERVAGERPGRVVGYRRGLEVSVAHVVEDDITLGTGMALDKGYNTVAIGASIGLGELLFRDADYSTSGLNADNPTYYKMVAEALRNLAGEADLIAEKAEESRRAFHTTNGWHADYNKAVEAERLREREEFRAAYKARRAAEQEADSDSGVDA